MARVSLVITLLLTVSLAGCSLPASDEPAPPPGSNGGDQPPDDRISCDKAVLPGEQEGEQGELLFLSCEGEGTGTQTGELSCPAPSDAELTASTDLADGQVRITVRDAQGQEVVNRTLGDTGGQARELPMSTGGAQAGTWTVQVDRLSGYDGEHRVELWCPQG